MPSSNEILDGLTAISNRFWYLGLAWHAALAVALVLLASGRRPTRRVAGALMVLPLHSVAFLAWSHGNPFTGSVFFLAAVGLLAIAARLPPERVVITDSWVERAGGACLVAFGWVYPHFLIGPSWAYLYAAPMGLIPCPTLSAVIGLSLLAGGLQSRGWSLWLASVGLFYGIVGTFALGVRMDVILAGGALALAAVGATQAREGKGTTPRPLHASS